MNDDTRQPGSETDEPVFASDDQDSTKPKEMESAVSDLEEPVFSASGESGDARETGLQQEVPEASDEPLEREFPPIEPVDVEEVTGKPIENEFEERDFHSQAAAAADSSWVNIAPDSETTEEPRPETEYNFFDETPAAEVAAAPPPTRKLGRTGPVWVLGGIALVVIAGLVWLGISRLTGSLESSTVVPSEPTVQQVAADAPTPAPPTSTPGPTPTPTPILLPINANVTVANTDGEGVLLRAEPGKAGHFIQTIEEGKTMVVLDSEPGSDHSEYPVFLDGYLWYRMRVPDMLDNEGNPLVGWSASNFFVVEVQ